MQLAALNYMLRSRLYELFIPFIIVAPTSLKKFVTGSGRGDKNIMLLEAYKKWGVDCKNDDENDAHALARVAQALYDSEQVTPKINLLKPQEEVIKMLLPQTNYV
jgi:crossover junction endodeoxyribonuclease RuvC